MCICTIENGQAMPWPSRSIHRQVKASDDAVAELRAVDRVVILVEAQRCTHGHPFLRGAFKPLRNPRDA